MTSSASILIFEGSTLFGSEEPFEDYIGEDPARECLQPGEEVAPELSAASHHVLDEA